MLFVSTMLRDLKHVVKPISTVIFHSQNISYEFFWPVFLFLWIKFIFVLDNKNAFTNFLRNYFPVSLDFLGSNWNESNFFFTRLSWVLFGRLRDWITNIFGNKWTKTRNKCIIFMILCLNCMLCCEHLFLFKFVKKCNNNF